MPLEDRNGRNDGHQIGGGGAADALDALGETEVAAVVSLGAHVAHDRVARNLQERGPNAEHKNARQAELQRSAEYTDGTSTATALSPRPSSNRFFLPMRAASTPPGTLKTANAMNTKNDSSVATTLLSLIVRLYGVRHGAHRVGNAHDEEGQENGDGSWPHRRSLLTCCGR